VQANVANKYPFLIETPEKQLGMRLDEIWYDAAGFVDNYQDRIRAVTLEEAKAVTENYLHPGNVLIVAVVSNGERAKEELLTRSTTLQLPSGAVEGDLKIENHQIKEIDLELNGDDIEVIKASEVFK
jgi:hypothetical protein